MSSIFLISLPLKRLHTQVNESNAWKEILGYKIKTQFHFEAANLPDDCKHTSVWHRCDLHTTPSSTVQMQVSYNTKTVSGEKCQNFPCLKGKLKHEKLSHFVENHVTRSHIQAQRTAVWNDWSSVRWPEPHDTVCPPNVWSTVKLCRSCLIYLSDIAAIHLLLVGICA